MSEKKEIELTEKQRIFCHEYIVDWNGSRAAKAAGYSEDSAKEIASENLTKPNIKEYIEKIKTDVAKEAGISKLMMLNELKNIATADMIRIMEKIKDKGLESLNENERKSIIEYYEGDSGVKVKTHDKIKAIQDIMKAMGWNEPEKIDISGNVQTVIKWGDQELKV